MTSQKQSQLTNEILQGNLIKLMFKLSTPAILGMLLISLNTFVDALFAGRLIGETAIAGISLASPLTSIIGGSALFIGIGSASILSRAIGSGDIKTQSKIFGNFIVMAVVISFFITSTGYSFSEELIVFMGGSGEVASAGAEYFKIYVLGSVFFVIAIGSSQIIKSEGRIRLATIFSGISVIINIVLNVIFISIFHWGIKGIALATVIAMFIYSIVNLIYFFSGKSSITVNPKKIFIAIDLLKDILLVGISELLTPIINLIQSFVVFKSISHYGIHSDIAFFGATETLISLVLILLNGFVQASQPVMGINYGARNYDRLKKAYLSFVISGTIFFTLLWLPLQLSPKTFLSWILPDFIFTNHDLLNFRILILLIPVMPFISLAVILFQSLGKGKVIVTILILRSFVLFIPLVLILSKIMGVSGIYQGMVITDFIILLIAIILIAREFKHFSKMQVKNLVF
ncbi:MATE family efflux transporter [Nostoc sp.]|uniref:MATE family efflux transporter n=1 Tax=Nostoc sp. TaxID=1180 RepID=UPI002FF45C8F